MESESNTPEPSSSVSAERPSIITTMYRQNQERKNRPSILTAVYRRKQEEKKALLISIKKQIEIVKDKKWEESLYKLTLVENMIRRLEGHAKK